MAVHQEIKDFVTGAVKGLCKNPIEVKIDFVESGRRTLCIVVYLNPTDIPLVRGKQGRNISSVEDLTRAISAKHGLQATVIINE